MRKTWALLAAAGLTVTAVTVTAPAQAATLCNGQTVTVLGTENGETLNGTAGIDVIAGLGGDDTINGLGGQDVICRVWGAIG